MRLAVSMNLCESYLHDLLKIRSEPDSDKSRIVEYVSSLLSEAGMDVSILDGEAPVILATYGETGVLFSGHLDTVPVGQNWTRNQGEVDGTRVYGRGTADMKGGVAAILTAAQDLVKKKVPFSVALTTDEETVMSGAVRLAEREELRDAPFILVCEPTDFKVVTREKGLLQLRIRTSGKAIHASTPQLGDNAVMKMNALLNALQQLVKIPEDPLEQLTVVPGTICGGVKVNVVPDSCEMELDVRIPPGDSVKATREMIEERLRKTGVQFEAEVIHSLPGVEGIIESEAGRVLLEVTGSTTSTVPYASEMAVYGRVNRNVALFGAGKPEVFHAADEWIDLKDLERVIPMYSEFALRCAGL